MKWIIRGNPSGFTGGTVTVPGDKSISHRGLMLGALADGTSMLRNLGLGADVRSTGSCLRQLGIDIEFSDDGTAEVTGGELRPFSGELDAGNSGTTMRLLAGILAGQPFETVLTGDESLSRRPMERVAEPLRRMGASVATVDGCPPLTIRGGNLTGIGFKPATASAQVKSAVLLAGLFAEGETSVTEPARTRDHTERMMSGSGIEIVVDGNRVTIHGQQRPHPIDLDVPGDFSSAAFFLAAGAVSAPVTVVNAGVNPTRTAFLDVLERFGARLSRADEVEQSGEPAASLLSTPADLTAIEIGPAEAPLLIDELPLVAWLATRARGQTWVRGATELRVKESDRIAAITTGLAAMGADIEELPDGFVVRGPSRLRGATCNSHGDHRIAMVLALAGSVAEGDTIIENVECVDISFPGFAEKLASLGVSFAVA